MQMWRKGKRSRRKEDEEERGCRMLTQQERDWGGEGKGEGEGEGAETESDLLRRDDCVHLQ